MDSAQPSPSSSSYESLEEAGPALLRWLSISLCFPTLVLLPLALLLLLLLFTTKRVHFNSRLLLSLIPVAVGLELLSRAAKVWLAQRQQRRHSPAILEEADQIDDQILRWAIAVPSVLGQLLLNGLPFALLVEKLFATIFFQHYEKQQRFRWLGAGLLGFQVHFRTKLSHTSATSLLLIPRNVRAIFV
jgi:hypothetical protein